MPSSVAALLSALAVVAAGPLEDGHAFLEKNKEEDGVTVMPSGLQYRVIQAASNKSAPRPGPAVACKCHYTGTMLDGTVFDSSRERGKPAIFQPNQVIKGWTEALQLMQEGDRWQLFIPSELAYGRRAPPKIGPDAVLTFDLELIAVGGGPNIGMLGATIFGPIKLWHLVGLAALWLLFYFVRLAMGAGGGGQKVTASHVLVKDEKQCEQLLVEITGAMSQGRAAGYAAFEKAAREHSTCPSGKSSGGSLGSFGPGQMVPAFDKVCWSAQIGTVVGPVQTNFGFHLILVTDRTAPDDAPEEVKGMSEGKPKAA
jgi:FKBP-type peptidyl-prolyl cis-trans isomerase FklB